MTKTCICDACGRVSTMALTDKRSHCCGSTMRVQEYVDESEAFDPTRKRSDIEVKHGNNVYLVRLVHGVPHILIRVDQNDDYDNCDGLLAPYERERIIELALGQKPVAETGCSTVRSRRQAAHGISVLESVWAASVSLRRVLEQLFSAANRIIRVLLRWMRTSNLPCSTTAITAHKNIRIGPMPDEKEQQDIDGQRQVIRGQEEGGRGARDPNGQRHRNSETGRITLSPIPKATGAGAGRIVVVVREDTIRNIIISMLASADFECHGVATGLEALAMLDGDEQFDLVLMTDRMINERDNVGLSYCIEMEHPTMPVVLVRAARRAIDVGHEALGKGSYDYLLNPVERMELLAIVWRALGTHGLRLENHSDNLPC